MNHAQTLFTVFFAIFWSSVDKAWTPWRPFHWPVALRKEGGPVLRRSLAAVACLNLLPVGTAAWTLWLLEDFPDTIEGGLASWIWVCVAGIMPAFSIFGFSRFWLGLVEAWPDRFYLKREALSKLGLPASCAEEEVEPSQETLRLHCSQTVGKADLISGVVYVAASLLIAALVA
ncbi:MAG TPA: hypothetical protein VIM86_00505 [Thermodesulfobacteriota bacterium]